MAVNIGSQAIIRVGTSSPATNTIEPTDFSPSWDNTFQDILGIGDTFKSRVMTMKDFSASFTLQLDTAITGVTQVMTAGTTGSSIFLRYLYNGTAGFQYECKIEGFSHSVSPDGITTISGTFKAISDVTVV